MLWVFLTLHTWVMTPTVSQDCDMEEERPDGSAGAKLQVTETLNSGPKAKSEMESLSQEPLETAFQTYDSLQIWNPLTGFPEEPAPPPHIHQGPHIPQCLLFIAASMESGS